MSKEVFISYKSEEYNEAIWVKNRLEKEGVSCWMAPMDIPGGSSYAVEITKAIKECKIYLLILSKGAQESKWVPRELDQAINENKLIMPFTIENCTLKDDFKFYLTNVQRYDAYLNKEGAMESMTKDIKKHLGIKEKAPEKPSEKPPTFADLGMEEFFGQPAKVSKEEQEKAEKQKALEQRMQKAIDNGMKKHRQKQKKKEFFANPKTKMGIIAGVALAILIGVVIYVFDGVTIAGERYSISKDYSLYLENKTLTAEDIEGISKLKELSLLKLINCTITESNISGLVGDELFDLTIENCQLTQEQVESLDFSNTNLWRCDLSGNENITSIDMLEPVMAKLNSIDISGTSVTDISLVASSPDLVEFYADGCQISDISPLSNCLRLEVLSLNGSGLTSLAGLENITILKHVYLSDNNLEDVTLLTKSASTIKSLFLRNNQISDISFLETFTALEYVGLDNNNISSLSSLENAAVLKGLSASGNKLTDTTGIEGARDLQYLNLANNNIKVVGGANTIVFSSTYGSVLDLSNNPLESVNISSEKTFQFISLANCDLTDCTFMENIDGYVLVINYGDVVDFDTIKGKSYYDVYLLGCPSDKKVAMEDLLGQSVVSFVDDTEDLSLVYQIENYYSDFMLGYVK